MPKAKKPVRKDSRLLKNLISFRAPLETIAALRAHAAAHEVSMASVILTAVREHLERSVV